MIEIGDRVFYYQSLKDNGRLEEYIDEDCKKVMEM